MTNKEAITYLEWLSNIDFRKKHPTYTMVTNPDQVEALKMAITALDQLDNNSTKPDNSTATQSNGIESKVKGFTACRVPEDDAISRRQAIDIFDDYNVSVENGELEAYSRDRKRLCDLPSAQPEQDREFLKLTVRNSNGRPYYSIIYLEVDDNGVGHDFEGYSSYSLDVISDYLKKYFMPSAQPEPERTMEEFMYGQDMGNPEDGSL